MITINATKEIASLYQRLLAELKPDWSVNIAEGDVNLYRLGFIDYFSYTVTIDVSEQDTWDLDDEVIQMEVDAYNIDEALHAKPRCELTLQELSIIENDEKYMKKYEKFAPLYQMWCDE